jgi:hypothetical protein
MNMKNLKIAVALTIALMLFLGAAPVSNTDDKDIIVDQSTFTSGEIIVNGVEISAPRPSVTDGVIMLPLRAIGEELGFDVLWQGAERRVSLGESNVLWIGKPLFSSDGGITAREFGPPPEIIEGRTFVPISFFNFGLTGFAAKIVDGKVIIDSTGFVFGKQAHAFHPKTVDEFVPVFAEQLARYNITAPLLWPDNAIIDKSVILEDVDTGRFWSVKPDGTVAALSAEDIDGMNVSRRERADDFSFYEGGMYITVSAQSVLEQVGGDSLHVGAYDSILWLTHEGFHKWEQSDKWKKPEQKDIANPGRDEFFLDIPARAKRNLLQRQLMQAVTRPDNPALILDALATYEDYKIQNADDYGQTPYFDQIEGTAKYFEVVSSLHIFYPNQIKSKEDVEQALAFLAHHEDNYLALGVVSESYTIGIFTCALLDRLDEGWKKRIMQEPQLTPLEMLASYYKGEKLPEPKQLTQEEIANVTEKIQEKIRFLVERQVSILTGLKEGLGDLPEAERLGMEAYLEYVLEKFVEMIKILPEEEQQAQEDFIKAMQE